MQFSVMWSKVHLNHIWTQSAYTGYNKTWNISRKTHLKCVCHSVQELDDKQRGDLSLDDGEEEELAPVYGDEIVVWGLQDRGHILRVHRLLLRLEEVVTHTPADDTLPVFLQEDVPRVIN